MNSTPSEAELRRAPRRRASVSVGRLGAWAVLDQCFFSGTNFLTAVLIGRLCGPAELGAYALCFSIIMLTICFERACLISPFVVVNRQLDGAQVDSLRGTMLCCAVTFGVVLAAISLGVSLFAPRDLAFAMAVALPAGLLRDFGRRLSIAELRVKSAFAYDFATAAIQISAIAVCGWSQQLSAVRALYIAAITWLLVSVVGLVVSRNRFAIRPDQFRIDILKLWPVGRWVGLSQMISTAQAFVMPWVMAVAHSIELAGIYAACWTIVQVASPAIEGLGNLVSPALASSAAKRSWSVLRTRVQIATLVFGSLMAAMTVAVILLGRPALELFYGVEYGRYLSVLVLLTIAATIINLGIPASKALTQLGLARVNFWITLAGLMTCVPLAFLLLRVLGSTGAAWGLVGGGALSTVARWVVFLRYDMTSTQLVGDATVTRTAVPELASAQGEDA